jgi:glucose-1-phosphate adenylyltransferase
MRNDVVAAILGGGRGTRLWPLTRHRAKPAVPVGGKFRLIDIPVSNCLHAGINRVFVLTQFNSASLHRHIAQTYRFDSFSSGFVNILAANQTLEKRDWFQGTADAVRQTLPRLAPHDASDVLILSGDQLYLMDLGDLIEQHRASGADLTICVQPVGAEAARELGLLRMDSSGRLVEFAEKPKDEETIGHFSLDKATIERLGLDAAPGDLLASMGIYVFRPGVLKSLLAGTSTTDFGKEVIPAAIEAHRVHGFLHRGYWRDIGTIPSFHQASLELADSDPSLDLYDPEQPIYTHPRFLPGARISGCAIESSIVCDGARLTGCRISRASIGVRAVVRPGSVLEQTVLMGSNAFEKGAPSDGVPPLGIGRDCEIRRAIIDLDARVGDGARLINEAGLRNADGDFYCIREGVIVVPAHAVVPPGAVI